MDKFLEIFPHIEELDFAKWSDEELHIVIDSALAGNREAAELLYNAYEDESGFNYVGECPELFWGCRDLTDKEEHDIKIILELALQYRKESDELLHEMVKRRQFQMMLMDYVMHHIEDIDDTHMKELIKGNEKYMSKAVVREAFDTWVEYNLLPKMIKVMEKYTPKDEIWEGVDLPF